MFANSPPLITKQHVAVWNVKNLIIIGILSFISIASKVREKLASIPFEQFDKHSADIITAAVFGKNADGEVNNEVIFAANNLVSTCSILVVSK